MRRVRLRLLLLAAVLALAPAAPAANGTRPQPVSGNATIPLAGLAAPVQIVNDRFGVPHVRARNLADLYFAWGYVTARDRGWQLVQQRQAGQGRMHRWLGNTVLTADGGAQLFRLRERAAAIWARDRADPALAVALERFSAGINAYFGRCRRGELPWPRELAHLHVEPEDWRPEDSVLLLLGLGVTLDLDAPEIGEARAMAEHGRGWIERRRRFESCWIYDTIPDSAAARLYSGRMPSRTAPDDPDARGGLSPAALERGERALAAWQPPRDADGADRASNEFAVGRGRSASGAPLLANDPHLALRAPGAFHALHLYVADTVDAIGAAVPGLPAIVSGRNRECAWGVTALSADVLDVYADTLSADTRQVRWEGGWEKVTVQPFEMRFRVLGVPLPVLGQVRRYTPHGPVVVWDPRHHLALSMRWSAMEDERITMRRLVGLERSRSADEVCERGRTLVTPCINWVAADRAGDLVYQTSGLLPLRSFTPSYGPLPGDGRHEWSGFVTSQLMPAWRPPADGFLVNANNRPVGPHYPVRLPRYDWVHDRALRIAQRLGGDRRVTRDDLASVQNDVASRGGARFVPLLIACADSVPGLLTPRMRAAVDMLRGWDFSARRSRVGPTLYRAWLGALQRRSRTEGLQGLMVAALEGRAPEALRAPGSERPERPALAAVAALDTALQTLERSLGPDLARWTWARAHRAHFAHALEASDPTGRWAPPWISIDGDNSTPAVGGSTLPWSTEVTHGPAFRHVVDLAVTDSSIGIVPPFDAAWPGAPSHAQRWAAHDYVPFYLAWDRIEQAREFEQTLTPARASPQ